MKLFVAWQTCCISATAVVSATDWIWNDYYCYIYYIIRIQWIREHNERIPTEMTKRIQRQIREYRLNVSVQSMHLPKRNEWNNVEWVARTVSVDIEMCMCTKMWNFRNEINVSGCCRCFCSSDDTMPRDALDRMCECVSMCRVKK